MSRKLRSFMALAFLFLLSHGVSFSHSADRFALVIGNQAYQRSGAELRNPRNDVRAVGDSLRRLGFRVTTATDLEQEQFEEAVLKFTRQLTPGSAALFFFAGHGLEINGTNYLVPVDAKLREDFEVKRQCVEVGYVLEALEASESNLRVCILDCCRDNPFKRGWRSSAAGSRSFNNKSSLGMAKMDAPKGTIIAFSTSPGATADDGRNNNSPYSQHLVRAFDSRPAEGLRLLSALRSASRSVKKATGQTPWLNLDATVEEFYLARRQTNSNFPRPTPPDDKEARFEPLDPGKKQSPPIDPKFTPIDPTDFFVENTSNLRDATLYVRLSTNKIEQIAPGKTKTYNHITGVFTFEYYDGTTWIKHTIDKRRQYPAARFRVEKENGTNKWMLQKPEA